jgi:hypothetical protein
LIVGTTITNTVSEGVCLVCHHLLYRHSRARADCAITPQACES